MKILKSFILIMFFASYTIPVFAENNTVNNSIPVCKNGGQNSKIDPFYCCKNGYTIGYHTDTTNNITKDYFTFAPKICGCPNNGRLIGEECFLNGYVYKNFLIDIQKFIDNPNLKKGDYKTVNANIGCPEGTQNKNGYCCDNGFALRDKYDGLEYIPEFCGCPDYGIYDEKTNLCVIDNTWIYNAHDKRYNILDATEYNCPADANKINYRGLKYCCKNNFAYNSQEETWSKYEIACGCPDGGKVFSRLLGTEAECCKNGYQYNPETGKYDIVNEYMCPQSGVKRFINKTCDFFQTILIIIAMPFIIKNVH